MTQHMFHVIIFVEYNRCEDLRKKYMEHGILIKCTQGSKTRAYERDGIIDDDYDFAYRFMETCHVSKAYKCVAIVRDERIINFIQDMLTNRYRQLNGKVEFVKIPFTATKEHVIETITRSIDRLLGKQLNL